jgi:hypothetical protein
MVTLEFSQPVEVTTAKGDGYIWYMIDYGAHADTLYTVIIKETGECWQMCHKDFRIKANISLGIKNVNSKPTSLIRNGYENMLNGNGVQLAPQHP